MVRILLVRMNLGVKLIRMNFEVDFLHVVKHIEIHLFDSVYSYGGCCQAHLGLSKVILNIKSAISQELIEL